MAIYIRPGSRARLPVQPDAWTPFYLGDALLAYWDAEDSSSLTLAGSNVTAWADRKGGYAPTQATSGSQPVFSATGFNGRPGVIFDGVDDYLELVPVPATFATGATPGEMWVLVDQLTPGATTSPGSAIAYGDNNLNRLLGRNSVSSVSRARAGTGTGTTVSAIDTGSVFDGRCIARGVFGAAVTSVSVNGNAATSAAAVPTTASTRLRLGASANPTVATYLNGVIGAVLVTSLLTADQATQLTTYLKARGGVT